LQELRGIVHGVGARKASFELSPERGCARGFTLIELINFLALGALLGAVAMFALARYERHSRTVEATGSLHAIAEGAKAYYEGSDSSQPAGTPTDAAHAMRHFPPPSRATVPANLEDIRGKRYQSTRDDWAGSPWRELRFSMAQPQSYAYGFDSQGTGTNAFARVTAMGDLDGDGKTSTFRLLINVDATGDARIDTIEKIDPEE
jgi:type II secretory pathway pseudopilin PulG